MADSIVNSTRAYAAGYATGVTKASRLAKSLRGTGAQVNTLAQIMDTMPAGGQRAGFCNELQRLLAAALRASDDRVGLMTEAQLAQRFKARDTLDELDMASAS